MRKPRDYDAELKTLKDKAKELKQRKVQQLGELVIATGADTLTTEELAAALIVLAKTKVRPDVRLGPNAARRGLAVNRGDQTQSGGAQPVGGARKTCIGTGVSGRYVQGLPMRR